MKGYIIENNHELPINDEMEHVAADWCRCSPIPVLVNGLVFWRHHSVDCREVVEQAEAIRGFTSVLLWREAEKQYTADQISFHPFHEKEVAWPPTAARHPHA